MTVSMRMRMTTVWRWSDGGGLTWESDCKGCFDRCIAQNPGTTALQPKRVMRRMDVDTRPCGVCLCSEEPFDVYWEAATAGQTRMPMFDTTC